MCDLEQAYQEPKPPTSSDDSERMFPEIFKPWRKCSGQKHYMHGPYFFWYTTSVVRQPMLLGASLNVPVTLQSCAGDDPVRNFEIGFGIVVTRHHFSRLGAPYYLNGI